MQITIGSSSSKNSFPVVVVGRETTDKPEQVAEAYRKVLEALTKATKE